MIFFTFSLKMVGNGKNDEHCTECTPVSPFPVLNFFVLFFIPRSPFLTLVTSTAGVADNAFA